MADEALIEGMKLEARNRMRHDPRVWHEALESAIDELLPALIEAVRQEERETYDPAKDERLARYMAMVTPLGYGAAIAVVEAMNRLIDVEHRDEEIAEQARQKERALLDYEHVEGIAYADDVAEGYEGPVPDDYTRHYCEADGEDWPCAYARHNEKVRQDEREKTLRDESMHLRERISDCEAARNEHPKGSQAWRALNEPLHHMRAEAMRLTSRADEFAARIREQGR
ncbi:hypothetical protein [Microbacterium gilvum]|uniref:Uncharacterized protein n=1 Tax=Microbacterium gilvum TaxID=1336204 RepID=A0ABP9A5C3_9MICO